MTENRKASFSPRTDFQRGHSYDEQGVVELGQTALNVEFQSTPCDDDGL